MSVKTVHVTSLAKGRRVEVDTRGHAFVMDEPDATDQGPAPYEMLLASLGACTAMTVTAYAERKGWPLEKVDIALTQEKVELTQADGTTVKHDVLTRTLRFLGPLDAEQLQRLQEIAGKCPVHKTLTSGALEVRTLMAPKD